MLMKKTRTLLIAVLACAFVLSPGCVKPQDEPEKQEQEQEKEKEKEPEPELEPLTSKIPVTENWIFSGRPAITFHLTNPNSVPMAATLKIYFTTDQKASVATVLKEEEVPANGVKDFVVSPDEDFAPGFYNAKCTVNGKSIRSFVFGVDPFDIVSAPDMQADFDAFWEAARADLPALDATSVTLTEIPAKSNAACKVYLAEILSVPDEPGGDPVYFRGYYLEPQDGRKHPVLIHFQGYDTLNKPPKMSCPSGNDGIFAEFYVSHRGQYINHRTADKRDDGIARDFENIYGDWFAYHFGNKDGYYYRGAFMDCVQTVRFMATRPTSNMDNLFAEGSSQGGALCYAAAALSDIPFNAIAPNVAFLGDYPDYFKIVSWPANVAKANKGSMTDDQMYAFLSYFDTKNLATRISCAVWATSGLQDGTCPPHTNLAPFNNLKSTDKHMSFYPEMQHDYPKTWFSDINTFFKERMK